MHSMDFEEFLWAMGYNDEFTADLLSEEGDSKNRDKISIFKQIIQHSARI